MRYRLPIIEILALVVFTLAAETRAHAQASLSFSGGNGAPFVLTLLAPISYTVTTPSGSSGGPYFVFEAPGNVTALNGRTVTGTIKFTIDLGQPQTITTVSSGLGAHDIQPDDIYVFGPVPGVTSGDLVTLSAGTIMTIDNISGAPPAAGSFTTFLTNGFGSRISSDGVSTPEPSAFALCALSCTVLLGVRRGRAGGRSGRAAGVDRQKREIPGADGGDSRIRALRGLSLTALRAAQIEIPDADFRDFSETVAALKVA